VANLPYEHRHGATKDGGTDLEFVTLTVKPGAVRNSGYEAPFTDADPDTPKLQRRFAIGGAYENGMQVVDVTDPEEARIVNAYDCGVYQGDIQIFTRDDLGGRTLVTLTQDNSRQGGKRASSCYQEAMAKGLMTAQDKDGTFILDVTDPYDPEPVGFVPVAKGSHNMTVHPSGRYLYNSNSDLITTALTAGIEVFEISDPANPVHVGDLSLPVRPGLGTESHDITFNADGTRAYSAALSQTVIIDTSSPGWPRIITSFVDPTINVEHQADPVTLTDPVLGERTFLFVEDEFAGASGAEQTCPSGGVHIYDITGDRENNPVKVGYWNIDDFTTTEAVGLGRCTAHVFELHEEEALMTIAFYGLGVSVVDLSSLVGLSLGGNGTGLTEVAFAHFDDSDTWAVKAPYVDRDGTFYIYGNDQQRGMDVYEVELGLDPAPGAGDGGAVRAAATGRDVWLTPQQAQQMLPTAALPTDYTPYCLLDPAASA
jgi:hypothetical protein